MKGNVYYHKGNKKYEAYLLINGEKITLGSFYKKNKAEERLQAAIEAVEEGQEIREWLASNPNRKAFSSSQEVFEDEYNSFLGEERETTTEDGYHKRMNILFTNFRRLQEKFEEELEGKTHIHKEVPFFDSAPDLFPTYKKNFRYWKAHLLKIGKQINYLNLNITEFELKMVLIKVFQKNIVLPNKLRPWSKNYSEEWQKIRVELDEIVEMCYYAGIPERKPKLQKKVIFNPKANLTKEERKQISIECSVATKKDKKLQQLLKHYTKGISKKKLHRDSGVAPNTIKKYWNELEKQAA